VRGLYDSARTLVEQLPEGLRRTELESDLQQAEVPLIEAARDGHAFVFDALEERLDTARNRLGALFARLLNP